MEKTEEVIIYDRSYWGPFIFCAGVLVGFFVMGFMTVHGLSKVQGTIDLTKICEVKK